ncbi:MAG: PD-(D/E)XK nuclease family protein, partial [Halopseudomonas sp.]
MAALLSIAPLHQALQQQQTILTPNRRLSRYILDSHALDQQQQGAKTWPTAAVFSLEGWIRQLWQQLQDSNNPLGLALLLDPQQELQLWQQSLEQDPDTQQWLQPAGAARHAQQALKALQLWQQHPQSEQLLPYLDEHFCLELWHNSFRSRCQELQAITFCDAVGRLIDAFHQGVLVKLPQVWLVGFQDIAPLYQALLAAAFEQQHSLQSDLPRGHCQRVACDTAEHEVQQAGQWARQVLQRIPGASVAIIDPQLSSRRELHERSFRQVLEPKRLFQQQAVDAPLFNMSIGTPLADCPVIDTAFVLLRLASRPLPLDELPLLLYSPFFGGLNTELEARVELEQQLRRLGLAELKLSQIQQQLSRLTARRQDAAEQGLSCCPQLEQCLQQLQKSQRLGRRPLSNWGPWIVNLLSQLGWPGERQASSLEYQQIKQWYEVLAGLNRFDALLVDQSFSEALKLLRSETQSTAFQPQTPDSAVQILGPLEAAGLRFSHLWVMGLNDERWPAPPELNPLLPAAYQQAMQMPHASADRELRFARELTQLFTNSAEQVVFSYPLRQDDQMLRPSALICEHPEVSIDELQLSPQRRFNQADSLPHPATLQSTAPLERINTAQAPAIGQTEREQLRGGSSILTNQALCPFSAFAIHRLGAKPLDTPQTGLSPADRGNLLHAILEQLWQQLHSHQALLAIAPDALQQLITAAIEQAIAPYRHRVPDWMGSYFWQLEQQRLHALTERWLELERQRPEFSVVA